MIDGTGDWVTDLVVFIVALVCLGALVAIVRLLAL